VIEFVIGIALIHEMLEEMMNLSLTTTGAVLHESKCRKTIKRTVRVTGTLNEKLGEMKKKKDVKLSGSMNHQPLA
jgi:hypothetical protein